MLSVAVQHHPIRAERLPALLRGLESLDVQVVEDPDPSGAPSAWRTYRAALEATPEGATHRLIVQDDALPCLNFAAALHGAVAARPDTMIALCVTGLSLLNVRLMQRARASGSSWASLDIRSFVPVIATIWPVRLIEPALAYVDAQTWPAHWIADDEIVGRIMRSLKEEVLATVPSLVDHDDGEASLVSSRRKQSPARRAALYASDAAGLTW